jgi:hypothetical protein
VVYQTGTYRCEFEFWAEGSWLGSDAKESRLYLKEFEIFINTFIPENNVPRPFAPSKVFGGDDRSFNKYGGARTNYRVKVLAPRASYSNHIISTYRLAGETSEYDAATSLDGSGRLTFAALNDWSWGGDKKLRWATADTSGLSCSTFRESPSVLRVHCWGNANNPLFDWGGLNDISYDLTVALSLPAQGSSTYEVTGQHDGFPNYEIYLGDQLVYPYEHGGQTPFSLGDGMEIPAYAWGVIW